MKLLTVRIRVNKDRLLFKEIGNREDLLLLQAKHATRSLFRRYYNRHADVELDGGCVWVNNEKYGEYTFDEYTTAQQTYRPSGAHNALPQSDQRDTFS